MDTTVITMDTPLEKRGSREGWLIEATAKADIRTEEVWLNVWITAPGGERIALRHGQIDVSRMADEVLQGWLTAVAEVDHRRFRSGAER